MLSEACRSGLLVNSIQVHRGSYTSQGTYSLAHTLLGQAMGNAQSSAIFDAASKDDLARLQEIVRREHIDLGSSDKVWGPSSSPAFRDNGWLLLLPEWRHMHHTLYLCAASQWMLSAKGWCR